LSSPEADLALLAEAARAAGSVAMAHFGRSPEAWDKPHGQGPVSAADLAVDGFLKANLRQARPDYGWLSEETPDDPARLGHDRVFIVDPIDGTRAFLQAKPGWCVALAVVDRGAVIAAAAFLPVTEELYAARLGGGATRNGEALVPSQRAEPTGAAVLAGGPQLAAEHWPGGAPMVARSFRPSLVHRLCLVAGGLADATLTFRPAWEWDIAAGALIAAEAGCTVTDGHGVPPRFNAPDPRLDGLLVASPGLHAALLTRRQGAAAQTRR
jgi:myo-inositol-1(or 4)-monophosphatase